jgi:hypothetical protein
MVNERRGNPLAAVAAEGVAVGLAAAAVDVLRHATPRSVAVVRCALPSTASLLVDPIRTLGARS